MYPGGWDDNAVGVVKDILAEGAFCKMLITNPRKRMVNNVLHVRANITPVSTL